MAGLIFLLMFTFPQLEAETLSPSAAESTMFKQSRATRGPASVETVEYNYVELDDELTEAGFTYRGCPECEDGIRRKNHLTVIPKDKIQKTD